MRLIDADELIKDIKKQCEEVCNEKKGSSWCEHVCAINDMIDWIEEAPTIEWKDIELMGYVNGEQITKIKPSKIEGHWITRDGYPHRIYCSICKVTFADEKWEVWKDGSLPRNYCPNCGSKMINQNTLIDKVGPVLEQIAETATNFFEDETISGLLEEGEE